MVWACLVLYREMADGSCGEVRGQACFRLTQTTLPLKSFLSYTPPSMLPPDSVEMCASPWGRLSMNSLCPKDSSASIAAAAGEAPTALQLLVGPAAASPAASAAASTGAVPVGPLLTRLAVVRGCSDASWLSHTPDRFVALLENGTACQLFDGKPINQKGGV